MIDVESRRAEGTWLMACLSESRQLEVRLIAELGRNIRTQTPEMMGKLELLCKFYITL